MNQDLLSEINSLSDGNIDFFIQFWSDRINIENADVEPMQADILFYLNSLKHFKAKVEEMQKALQQTRTGISNAYEFGYLKETDQKDVHNMLERINEALKGETQ